MTRPRYTPAAIALHWILAALIVFNLAFGFYTVELPLSPQKLRFFSFHKWIGVTISAQNRFPANRAESCSST